MQLSLQPSTGLRLALALVPLAGAAWPGNARAQSVAVSASASGEDASASASASVSGGPRGLFTTDEKAGRMMANLKLGPSFLAYPTYGSGVTFAMAALTLEFGYAVTPDRNGYLTGKLDFQMSSLVSYISIPAIGFQYDVRLPVRGLYLTPRGSIGYALAVGTSTATCGIAACITQTSYEHLGVFTAEIGVKYIYRGRFNFGFDPFSLPIYFNGPSTECIGSSCVSRAGVGVFYRFQFYAGANF